VIVRALQDAVAIEDVGETVMLRVGIPKDRWEIAAQLEVLGYRDADVRDRFGVRDLFEAADKIFALFQDGKIAFHLEAEDPKEKVNPVVRFFRHYLDGLMFSLPMVVQGATMLLWGYGLWGAIDLSVRTGSAIALGFIASYVVTSGFTWAIVSRGLFYGYQKEGGLARWSALRMWSVSIRVALGLAIPALLFNLVFRVLPLDMAFIAAAYYAGLVLLWLNWSLTYLVRRTHWLLGVIFLSILLVVFIAEVLGWPIIAANLIGLAVADALTFFIGVSGLKRDARSGVGNPTVNPPRLTVLIYATAPAFAYGFLYSAFIFADRVLAWTSARGREDFPPYPFWMNTRYELGMDLALIVVVLVAGVVEYSTHRFSSQLIPSEKRVKSSALEPFVAEFRAFYRRHTLILCGSTIVAVVLAGLVYEALKRFPDVRLQESLASDTTRQVFWIAAISYSIFMFALQNVLMLMTLSRADVAARAIGTALLINIVAGWILSRSIGYSAAVFGLLAGAVTLAVLAHRALRRVISDLDYYYYAAY
jgi:hypothetical protein